MNDLEKMVWAAAFANEFNIARKWYQKYDMKDWDTKLSGYSCAEIADLCLEKFREAMQSDDKEYLTPIKEKWNEKS